MAVLLWRSSSAVVTQWAKKIWSIFKDSKRINNEAPQEIDFNAEAVIISADESPSVDYFVKPFLVKKGIAATLVRADGDNRISAAWQGVKLVVVVRYLPKNWVRPLEDFRSAGGRIVYFMDDDLMDERSFLNLPTAYAKKIKYLATNKLSIIEKLSNEFWVSSEFLAKKYARWSPTILPARPEKELLAPRSSISIFYHGTSSHQSELLWLVPIIHVVQSRSEATQFEVFGDLHINRLYRGIPRVAVLHPMRWPAYVAFTHSVHRHIGLAPLMPEPFNEARAPTKFFDFVRMGAIGLYSDVAPYKDFIRNGIDGILLPNDPDIWIAAIVELVSDAARRDRMVQAARQRAIELTSL